MANALLIDFGSTFTKAALVDLEQAQLVASAQSHTTVNTNIMEGLRQALATMPQALLEQVEIRLACSSAAGGLKMVAVGLVKDLTVEAAKRAALGAGARVLEVFSHELTERDLGRIAGLKPDIILLAGGTDGGNKEVILHNALALSRLPLSIPVVVAGNRVAAPEAASILRRRHDPVLVVDNVMPELNAVNVEEARLAIRGLFLKRIVRAKGLELAEEFAGKILMPTPAAVLRGAELLACGYGSEPGLGDLLVVDIGGATTDVHSVARGEPTKAGVNLKGLPEPYAKRTVEGDLGMRYSARALFETAGSRLTGYLGMPAKVIQDYLDRLEGKPAYLAQSLPEKRLDGGLARIAVELAVERHCGSLEVIYTPFGASYIQHGKDLTGLKTVIGTGGVLAYGDRSLEVLKGVEFRPEDPTRLRPQRPDYYADVDYLLAGMGLLAELNPRVALRMMKEHLVKLK